MCRKSAGITENLQKICRKSAENPQVLQKMCRKSAGNLQNICRHYRKSAGIAENLQKMYRKSAGITENLQKICRYYRKCAELISSPYCALSRVYVFCCASCKTSQNVNISQLLACLKTTAIMDAKRIWTISTIY